MSQEVDGTISSDSYSVTFDFDLISPLDEEYIIPEFEVDLPEFSKNVTEEFIARPSFEIFEIDSVGIVYVQMNETLLPPENISYVNSSSLILEITAANQDYQHYMGFEW